MKITILRKIYACTDPCRRGHCLVAACRVFGGTMYVLSKIEMACIYRNDVYDYIIEEKGWWSGRVMLIIIMGWS